MGRKVENDYLKDKLCISVINIIINLIITELLLLR